MHPSPEQFVHWFRSAAPYIHAFRGRTFVIAFGGEVVADGKFVALTHDLNLLASLGVRLVLVHGTRPQIEAQMKSRGIRPRYVRGLRVTDEASMQCVKQANGQLRVEIEALLSMGLPDSPMANATIRVAGGNFVVARPRGVVDGVDMQYTGEVRRVHAEAIAQAPGRRRARAALAARLFTHRRDLQSHHGGRCGRDGHRAGRRQADLPDRRRRASPTPTAS